MRFLYKRPRMEHVQEELDTLMEVMVSDLFIYLDLFLFSLIFTLLLSPIINSFALSILFFIAAYSLFSSLYYFLISRIMNKS
ncbi:hypothetical protein BABA_08776 [Neobacillus bataviensis LMG 21833]|uniref:Uncharacterized protein n=1 Tax=Neobacillus bataviensis LMG 21833 TaxID=1117379 RepID=K6DMX7_9BACI|nr:hypothetical protein [Neobacillus bataviensis]EKN69508.1 hypothetical protein BABA_08776 [Neobacillus bataviensis LMG 21833]